jgi:hypothetical protein
MTSDLLRELAGLFAIEAEHEADHHRIDLANHLDNEAARIRKRAAKAERAELRALTKLEENGSKRSENCSAERAG